MMKIIVSSESEEDSSSDTEIDFICEEHINYTHDLREFGCTKRPRRNKRKKAKTKDKNDCTEDFNEGSMAEPSEEDIEETEANKIPEGEKLWYTITSLH
jgi:hypothetical protein